MGNRRYPFRRERVQAVHFQLLLVEQHGPEHGLGDERFVGTSRDESTLQRASVREIALEMRGVDVDPADFAWHRQFDDAPVTARFATSAGFPAFTHIGRACRQEQI